MNLKIQTKLLQPTLLAALGLSALCGSAAAQSLKNLEHTPRLTVPRAPMAEQVFVDGNLEERAWEYGTMTYGFVAESLDQAPEVDTRARVLYDYHNLYIAFSAREPNLDGLKAKSRNGNKKVRQDDAVGFKLSYDSESGASGELELWVNSENAVFDSLKKDGDKVRDLEGLQTAVHKRDGVWDVEIAIPFLTLGVDLPRFGEVWNINFMRERYGSARESSSWLDRETQGEIRFGRDMVVYLYSKRPYHASDEIMAFNFGHRVRYFEGEYLTDEGNISQEIPIQLGPGHRRQHYRMDSLEKGNMYYVIVRKVEAKRDEDNVIMVVPRPQW